MSTERGKSHLAPPALKSPKLVLAKNAKFCLKKKSYETYHPQKGFQFVSLKPRTTLSVLRCA